MRLSLGRETMIHPAIPLTLLALAAPVALDGSTRVGRVQMSIHERIVIRVPRLSHAPVAAPGRQPMTPPLDWREHKGPKCVAAADIAGAMPTRAGPTRAGPTRAGPTREGPTRAGPTSVGPTRAGAIDLLMNDGVRLRAKLDGECTSLDYYDGLYIRPASDGRICRDRDAIRTRSGASCDIDEFKTLRAQR